MILSNCISVLSVNAETATNIEGTAVSDNTLITDPEQIKNLLESFIEQNYKGEAIVCEYSFDADETGIIYDVEFSCPDVNDPRFYDKYYSDGVYSEFEKFFKENKIDSSIVAVHFLEGGTAADNTLITDPEQIKNLLESFIEQNYKDEAQVCEYSDTDETGIIYEVVFSSSKILGNRDVIDEFEQFYKENNIDSSIVSIVFNDLLLVNYGDLNDDGTADLTDLTLLSLYLMKSADFTDSQIEAADIDGSGEVDIADLAYFKQYICKDQSVMSKLRIGKF